jgi:hypothetical protein
MMRKLLFIFIVITTITCGDVFACSGSRTGSRASSSYSHHPTTVRSMPQPIIPPGFPYKWFNKKMLDDQDIRPVEKKDNNPLTFKTKR